LAIIYALGSCLGICGKYLLLYDFARTLQKMEILGNCGLHHDVSNFQIPISSALFASSMDFGRGIIEDFKTDRLDDCGGDR
jgi:hypothetical protein